MAQKENINLRYIWQDKMAASGLREVLALAQQFRDSGLFDEQEFAPIRGELKELALMMTENLLTRLTEDEPETGPPAEVIELRSRGVKEVRGRLKRLGDTVAKSKPAKR